jgi:hypothetical protein
MFSGSGATADRTPPSGVGCEAGKRSGGYTAGGGTTSPGGPDPRANSDRGVSAGEQGTGWNWP